MKRTDLIKKAMLGDSDYHSLMRSVVFDIIPDYPKTPAKIPLENLTSYPFKYRWVKHKHYIYEYRLVENNLRGVVPTIVGHMDILTVEFEFDVCFACTWLIGQFLEEISPTLDFKWSNKDKCAFCGLEAEDDIPF